MLNAECRDALQCFASFRIPNSTFSIILLEYLLTSAR